MSAWRDFWLSCGHHLLDRDATGKLLVTDEFLKAYLARPELMPPVEACSAERGLHSALLRDPRQPIAASRVAAIADADTRENWQTMVAWRDYLVRYCSLEAAYLEIVRRNIKFPHILICHLVQAILRNALDDCGDVFMLRAAEMFFRPQRLVLQEASIVAIDEEADPSPGLHSPSPLSTLLGLLPTAEIDLLSDSTAESYWERSDRFDMALDLTTGRRGLIALGDVVARWLSHLLAIDVVVEPLAEPQSVPFSWYVGLSFDATCIGDAIWNGDDLDDTARAQLVSLFRLTFRDPADVVENVRGEPLYACDELGRDVAAEAAKSDNRFAHPPGGGSELRTTALARISVGVTVERRKARSAWADFLWRPVSVFTGSPSAAPWTPLGMEAETTLFYAGEAAIELHRTETSSYRDNLASGAPALWIVLRPTASELPYELVAVTADPAEGEGFTDAGNNLVEQVPIPPDIAEMVGQFVAQHHIDRPFVKRRRDGQTLPDRKERTSSD